MDTDEDTSDAVLARLPEPLSPGGTFYVSRAMDQGLALLRKEQRESARRDETLRVTAKKMERVMNMNARRDAASPLELVPDARPCTPPLRTQVKHR